MISNATMVSKVIVATMWSNVMVITMWLKTRQTDRHGRAYKLFFAHAGAWITPNIETVKIWKTAVVTYFEDCGCDVFWRLRLWRILKTAVVTYLEDCGCDVFWRLRLWRILKTAVVTYFEGAVRDTCPEGLVKKRWTQSPEYEARAQLTQLRRLVGWLVGLTL
jgi:predicted NAD/FAD-binding protein